MSTETELSEVTCGKCPYFVPNEGKLSSNQEGYCSNILAPIRMVSGATFPLIVLQLRHAVDLEQDPSLLEKIKAKVEHCKAPFCPNPRIKDSLSVIDVKNLIIIEQSPNLPENLPDLYNLG